MKKPLTALLMAVLLMISCCACTEAPAEGNSSVVPSVPDVLRPFALGETEGNTYTNSFLRLSFTLEDGWTFKTKAQLAAMCNITEDEFTEEKAQDLCKSGGYCDMMALSEDEGQSVNVTVQNIGIPGLSATVEELAEGSLSAGKTAFENAGYTVKAAELREVSFCGQTVPGAFVKVSYDGAETVQLQVYVLQGVHYAAITIAAHAEEDITRLLSAFVSV